ncbi:MAG: pilin [bacterium]
MKKIKSLFILTAILCFVAMPVLVGKVGAQTDDEKGVDPWGLRDADTTLDDNYVTSSTGLGQKDPRATAVSIINVMLGFLGIIAVVIILIGGFKWMTAGGNEDQVGEAKKWIFSGIIGLLIILASYALAKFAVDQLIKATSTPSD